MNQDRKTAIWVGVLYIVATVFPVAALVPYTALVEGDGLLANAATHEGDLIAVAVLNLVMAVAVAGVAFMIYPILRRAADTPVRQGLAAWYVGTRVTEGAAFLVGILATMAFLPLSRAFLAAGAPDDSYFEVSALVLESSSDLAYALGQSVFAVGAAMLYYLLLRCRLVPGWLAVWGLVASPLFLVGSLSLMWTSDPNSTFSTILYAPMALQEMVLALWLIIKGFNSVLATESRADSAVRIE